MKKKPWAGRFKQSTAKVVERFTESVSFDQRLWPQDIEGSIAHATMLGKQGIIPKADADAIVKGLKDIATQIEAGKFKFTQELEDVHMNIESTLKSQVGAAGGRLHTARSRNDQVALDLRLYLRAQCDRMGNMIKALQRVLVDIAQRHADALMPGYTHMQRAQPVLLSQHMLAYAHMLERDRGRFADCRKRLNVLPLGAAALAGTSLPIDRKLVAKLLGFDAVTPNSMDTVADRDFALEFCFAASCTMMHLSRLSEELVLWSGTEFSFIELPDAFATGSSIMPQKKNPDVPELVRGKVGRVYGNLVALLTIMKGLPMTYNRDMQEDKEPIFDTVDTLAGCLEVLTEMLPHVKFNVKRMAEAAGMGFSTATDVAEYLVQKGLPFRDAHEVAGKLVAYCIERSIGLEDLKFEDFKKHSPLFKPDVLKVLSAEASVRRRNSEGSASVKEVQKQIKHFTKALK